MDPSEKAVDITWYLMGGIVAAILGIVAFTLGVNKGRSVSRKETGK